MSRWTVTAIDAEDGSGDLLLPLPDDLLAEAGWAPGDVLVWTIEDGSVVLKRRINENSSAE